MDIIDSYRDEDGQPKLEFADARIVLDVRLCELDAPLLGSWAACPGEECGRVASRSVGDDPWVPCVCGIRFNTNYSPIGNMAWPEPRDGEPIKVPAEGIKRVL